jgi:hypothetical protein
MQNIINNVTTSFQKNITNACSTNSTNVQSVTIANVHATGCNLNITGINQSINVTLNASCGQTATFQDSVKTAFGASVSDMITQLRDVATMKGLNIDSQLNELTNINTQDTLNALSSCIVQNLNSQQVDIHDINVICTPTVTTMGPLTFATPQTLNIGDINQYISASVVSSCTQVLSAYYDKLSQIDKVLYPQQQAPSSTSTGSGPVVIDAAKNTLYGNIGNVAVIVLLILVSIICLIFIIYFAVKISNLNTVRGSSPQIRVCKSYKL